MHIHDETTGFYAACTALGGALGIAGKILGDWWKAKLADKRQSHKQNETSADHWRKRFDDLIKVQREMAEKMLELTAENGRLQAENERLKSDKTSSS